VLQPEAPREGRAALTVDVLAEATRLQRTDDIAVGLLLAGVATGRSFFADQPSRGGARLRRLFPCPLARTDRNAFRASLLAVVRADIDWRVRVAVDVDPVSML
jgi:hypothetical protein